MPLTMRANSVMILNQRCQQSLGDEHWAALVWVLMV